jgi:hypothetical protein
VPTSIHEIPLALLDERPSMLLDLLRAVGGPHVVADEVEPVSETFAQIEPATYSADRVYVARQDGEPVATLVVEMQRAKLAEKKWSWPLYLASAHMRTRRATWLVVLSLDAAVAAWASEPIHTLQGGVLRPIVIGPDDIPHGARESSPELLVLSTMAHGTGVRGGEIAALALRAVHEATHLDEDRARLYNDVVLFSIDDVARAALEASMDTKGWEWKSDFARHWVGVGVEQGLEQGLEQGRAEGERRAIRTLCEALHIEWTSEREARLVGATLDELEALVRRIATERAWND